MEILTLTALIALAFALLYLIFILFKFGQLAFCDSPPSEEERQARLQKDFPPTNKSTTKQLAGSKDLEEKSGSETISPVQSSNLPNYTQVSLTSPEEETLLPQKAVVRQLQSSKINKPLSPVESLYYGEEIMKRFQSPNNFHTLRQQSERVEAYSNTNAIISTNPIRQPNLHYVETSDEHDSGYERMYPSASFATLSECPSVTVLNRYKNTRAAEPESLVADSSLVIGTASSNGKIVGYCVNLVRRKCSFYSYDIDQIPLEGFFSSDAELLEPSEVVPVENLYFATLLWHNKIQKYQTFRLYSNHPVDSNESQSNKQLENFLHHLQAKTQDGRVIKMNDKYYIGSNLQSSYSNSYEASTMHLLNGHLSQFQAIITDKLKIENVRGTHKLQQETVIGKVNITCTTKYESYLNRVSVVLQKQTSDCSSYYASPLTSIHDLRSFDK